jgi:hypothetical protein
MATIKKSMRSRSTELSATAGIRTGTNVSDLKQSFLDNLLCGLGRADDRYTPTLMQRWP